MLKAIHAQESKKASREKAAAVVTELKAMKLPEAAKKVEAGIEETLTYCDFPSEHLSPTISLTPSRPRPRSHWKKLTQLALSSFMPSAAPKTSR